MPALPAPDGILGDGRVALRLSAERDIPEILIAHQDDRALHRRLRRPRAPSGAELGRAHELAGGERAAGRRLELTITAPGSDGCIGQVLLHEVDWDNRRAELQVWVAPRARGHGYAAAALRLTAGWLLAASELERLELLADPDDEPLLAAAASAGFTREGVLRGYRTGRGRGRRRRARLDAVVLSMLPEDLA